MVNRKDSSSSKGKQSSPVNESEDTQSYRARFTPSRFDAQLSDDAKSFVDKALSEKIVKLTPNSRS